MLRIVIIEEDTLMRGLLVEWLNAEGYCVRAAGTGDACGISDVLIVAVPRCDECSAVAVA